MIRNISMFGTSIFSPLTRRARTLAFPISVALAGYAFAASGCAGRQRPENFHRFRTDPAEIEALQCLDNPNECKAKITIPEFTPPTNKHFVTLVQLAKQNGLNLQIANRPLGLLYVRGFNRNPRAQRLFDTSSRMDKHIFKNSPKQTVRGGGYALPPITLMNEILVDSFLDQVELIKQEKIEIYPVTTYIDVDADHIRIIQVDSFSNAVLHRALYSTEEFDLASALEQASKNFNLKALQAELANLPPLSAAEKARWQRKVAFHFLTPQEVEQSVINKAQNEWQSNKAVPRINIKAFSSVFEQDLPSESYLSTDEINLDKKEFAPIGVRGRTIEITIYKGKDYYCGVKFPEKYAGELLNGDGCWVMVLGQHFAKSHTEPAWLPIVLDLTPFGLGKIEHVFYRENIFPVDILPSRKIYADEGQDFYNRFKGKIRSSLSGIEEMERSFSHVPGTRIQEVYIPFTASENYTVNIRHPERVNLYQKGVEKHSIDGIKHFGRHEAAHSYDFLYKISDYASFEGWFNQLKEANKSDFFNFINESYFFELPMGGHAQENKYEFLATLTNSLFSPKRVEKLENTSAENRQLYFQSLAQLREAIIATVPAAKTLFIIRKIDEVLQEE